MGPSSSIRLADGFGCYRGMVRGLGVMRGGRLWGGIMGGLCGGKWRRGRVRGWNCSDVVVGRCVSRSLLIIYIISNNIT